MSTIAKLVAATFVAAVVVRVITRLRDVDYDRPVFLHPDDDGFNLMRDDNFDFSDE